MNELFRDPIGIVREVVAGFRRDDGIGLSAESAYRLVFALPALVIFFASLSTLVAQYTGVDPFQDLLTRAEQDLPSEVFGTLELVLDSVEEQSGAGVLTLGFVLFMWSGSNAIATIIKAINRAHDLGDERGFVQHRIMALGLTIALGLLVISSFVLLVFGDTVRSDLEEAFGIGGVYTLLWDILRWPGLLLLSMAALALLYRFGPAHPEVRKALLPGVLCATLLWLIASYGFSIYLSLADPENAYGLIGGILVLLFFLYLSSFTIIAGGQVNAAVTRRRYGSIASLKREDHPLDLMPDPIDNTVPGPGGRAATWVVAGMLVGGAILGGIFRRGTRDGALPPDDH